MELRDPPFEVVNVLCPSCELIGYHEEDEREQQKGTATPPRYGIRYGFKRIKEM